MPRIKTVEELDDFLATPSPMLVNSIGELRDGLLILGAGGKMGFTLAYMAARAREAAGLEFPIIAVSRFSDCVQKRRFEKVGIETVSCDLLNEEALKRLPTVRNVIFMVGRKFGTKGAESFTWVTNAFLPGLIARRYRDSRIVVFSTGNVYPYVSVSSGGATEETIPSPVGEYAQSCLGRERVFEYFCITQNTPMAILRLNYANELRYGVLVDIALCVWEEKPIDVSMPFVNVLWQGDACDWALRAFRLCSVPPTILNITGPEIVSVRDVAKKFGEKFGKEPIFIGTEHDTALLSNPAKAIELFGPPRVTVEQMIELIAGWVLMGGEIYDKPTYFWVRDGGF
ncbi:MAG: epimerase [Candidatus Bathyarchaeia archaeon]